MSQLPTKTRVRVFVAAACLGTLAISTNLYAGQVDQTIGRVEFDFPDAPRANVEVDLSNEMLSGFTAIAKAAVEGVSEGLLESSDAHAVQQSAEHLHAVNEILDVTSQVIQEVRVRVYESLPESETRAAMIRHYQQKLDGTNWQNVVRVHEDDDSIIICVNQQQATIRGVFVMVSDGDELVLANAVCDLTPEKVKQLTSKATRIGMKFGMEDAIEDVMREISKAGH